MNFAQMRRSLNLRPFQPFAMLLTDQRSLEIRHPENIELVDHRTAAVWTGGEGEPEIVDLLHVISLQPLVDRMDI